MGTTVQRHPRVEVADVLRGFAVMGIMLLHNIEHFNFYSFPDTAGQSALLNFCDRSIWDGLFFMLGGKAYAIFALLFGFSFFIQDDNSRMRGNDFRARFCWRLLLLFIIGNINAMFFTAEILVMYSLIGFVLVLTCRLSSRWLIAIGTLCMLQPVALYHTLMAVFTDGYVTPQIPSSHLWKAAFEMQTNGTFAQMVSVNMWEGQLASLAWAWDHGRIFQTAGLFIFGMLLGRSGGMLRDKVRLWGVAACVAAACFFPLSSLNTMLPDYIADKNITMPLRVVLSSLANVAFMVMLVSGIIFLYYRTSMRDILSKLIPYGRMSMTNYVSQSIIGSFLYYNWGLGLHRYLGITASFLVGIALFILQYAFCRWWMTRYSHGPMEAAWKRLTWI